MENTIGGRIAVHRKRMHLTQEQLADKLGITAQAVSKWENDQSCPDINTLPLLADIFGISTDTLLGRVQMPTVISSQFSHSGQADTEPENIDDDDDDNLDDENDYVVYSDRTHQHSRKRSRKPRLIDTGKLHLVGLAVWFLTVGVLYLLSKLLVWDCTFWDILWPSFLLVLGLFGLIKHVSLFPLACTSVGCFFLVSNIVPLSIDLDKGILWAAIIIVCGVMLLLDAIRKKNHKRFVINSDAPSNEYRVEGGFLACSNSFGEESQIVIAEQLIGGKISNSFGEYTVNLSGVESVSSDCNIEVSCSFGELILLVPKRFTVVHKSSKAFADFSVSGTPDEISDGEIKLNASVSFGDLTLKYI